MQTLQRMSLIVVAVLLIMAMVVQARKIEAVGSSTRPVSAASIAPAVIRAEGWVVAYPGAEVTVGTDVSGTVVRMLVQEKDRVRKGQLIAEIRSDDTRAALEEARATVAQAEADIRLFDVEVTRAQMLYDEKVGTKQALDHAIRDRDAAIARRDTAAATVRRLEAMVDKTSIYAPISGVILSRLVQPGETVKENSPLIEMADLNRTRIEAEVDEFDTGRVHIGDEVKIRAEGYDKQQWSGRVEEIPDSVVGRQLKPQDPTKPIDTRVLLAKVAFQEPTPLKLGQKVEIEIQSQPKVSAESGAHD
ncbi:MAG TPA: efflux RND transporter periplasmic adaptor subunit [Terriglobales bacterium]|nr:efflux RND transporter periplasmic adaptor subunit [Terriglobales bacterium]